MIKKRQISDSKESGDLEILMQKVSLIVSLVALVLMAGGFIDLLFRRTQFSFPGNPVLPFSTLIHPSTAPWYLIAMSTGILLLTLLPTVRVLLAMWSYIRCWNLVSALIALIVVIELLLSIFIEGG